MLLKGCLNGARRPAEHPALPVTPAALAADAARVVAVGVGALHAHPKDRAGADTLVGDEVAAVLKAVRAAAPTVAVGITTGAWTIEDPAERVKAIRAWTVLPDFASVNWHEPGAEDVAEVLLERGVGVEAGLWHAQAAREWATSAYRNRCCRVLIELAAGLDAADTKTEADRLLAIVRSVGHTTLVLVHGEDTSCWPALQYAGHRRLQARIGLEDVLRLPDGSPAPDNAALVVAARALLNQHA